MSDPPTADPPTSAPTTSAPARHKDVGAVVHALHILRFLAASTAPPGVAAVARGTGINTSTCFNILRTLVRARFAAFNEGDKTYGLGLALAELGAGLVGVSHAQLIRPELERLALNYEVLILLWRATDENHFVLIDRAHSRTALRVEIGVGYRLPLLAGAIGRCVAAHLTLPSAELRRRFASLRWQVPFTLEEYEAEAALARRDGFGLDDGKLFRGIATVAALVVDGERRPRFGFSAVSIAAQQSPERLRELGGDLRDLAAIVGRSLFPPQGGDRGSERA